jgi:hypothetical protein
MDRRVCVLLTALVWPLGGAGDAALDRATLRGLMAINVVIDPVGPEIQKEGATANGLLTRLEQQLRDAGVPIDTASTEFVGLRVTSVRAARGPLAIALTLGLYQPVTLVRDRNIKTATQTWEVQTVVLADTKQVYRACMDSVDDLAGRFVKAYQSVKAAGGERDK